MEDLGAHADRLGEVHGALGADHEFLDVDGRIGVGAAVEDVHHGHREDLGIDAPDVPEERDAQHVGRRPCRGQGDAEDRVGAELGFGLGSVHLQQERIQAVLVQRIVAEELRRDDLIHVGDRLANALAEIALLVAVAQLDGLVFAGRCAGGNCGAAVGTVGEGHFDLHGRVAARVDDLASKYIDDL